MSNHGYFVNGAADAYFFDQDQRKLVYLEKDDQELRILLGDATRLTARTSYTATFLSTC